MIRHVVMFEFLNEAEGRTATQNAVIAKDKLLALKDKVEVIRNIEVGINDGEADDSNYTLCLTVDVESFEDLNAYQSHPEHLEAAAFIGRVRLSRACVDYEM